MSSNVNDDSENVCSLLIELYNVVEHQKQVPTSVCSKEDLCDNINAKLTTIMRKLLSTPYTRNFNLNIADPATVGQLSADVHPTHPVHPVQAAASLI
jgi:hypothetical protein